MNDFSTKKLSPQNFRAEQVKDILTSVHKSLVEKGYNPISQLCGYLLSGDPTYITSYNNARSVVSQIERDEILEELISDYLQRYEKE